MSGSVKRDQTLFETAAFTAAGEEWSMVLRLDELDPRVSENPVFANLDTTINAKVRGGVSNGIPYLDVGASGTFHLVCQRCLGTVDFDLDENGRIHIFEDEVKLESFEDAHPEEEGVVFEGQGFNPVQLIEDLVLIGLPVVPKHEDGKCDNDLLEKYSEKPSSPFDVLKDLKDD